MSEDRCSSEVVTIRYDDLLQPGKSDLSHKICQAFGPGALGLITVAGVPGYEACRSRLLPLAQRFASLPDAVKAAYEDEQSSWSFGWSQGREILEGGQHDKYKASYYANPCLDRPTEDGALMEKYPDYCRQNIWPAAEHFPELEPAFKDLGQLIVKVGMQVAEACDRYVVGQQPKAAPQRIAESIRNSRCHKARLLHYFPPQSSGVADGAGGDGAGASWCGLHRDHGCLTGLTSAMFITEGGRSTPCPDGRAGLHVRSRDGQFVRVVIPEGHIAYQLGEVAQALSGGLLCATPHYVKAPDMHNADNAGVSRNTFAVFMQPNWDEELEMPAWAAESDVLTAGGLKEWTQNCTFGEFASRTIKGYY